MNQRTYTFVFALIVCVACSVMLSAISEGLRPKQELNADLEVKKNILKAVGEHVPAKANPQDVLKLYESKIEELVIDDQGNVVADKKAKNLTEDDKNLFPLYIYKEGDQVLAYCYPVSGYGLWSMLYGYLAMEADGATIRGITFYKHGETPGLGAEIESAWFQDNFKGKKIWSAKENKLEPIHVVKGKVSNLYQDERADHAVDGITAATLTSNGVTKLLDRWIRAYDPYFAKIRKV